MDLKQAQQALAGANSPGSGEYGLVMLDQVKMALHRNLIQLPDLLSVLRRRHRNAELISTGCCAPPALIAAASL